ncbi:MAG: hypothetical protein ABI456_01615 [Ktedonobacteraceae bacterium]
MDVALITCAEYPRLSTSDALLLPALAARDIDACPLIWNDPAVDWSLPVVSVIRSTWDYHHQRTAFLEWAQHVSQLHALWNPFPLLCWNTHKSYLRDLERDGIPIIPTLWLSQETSANLTGLMREHGWTKVVVKPAVSASAYATLLVKEETVTQGQQHLDQMLSTHDMLIQPFLPTVIDPGERSLVFIDGTFTHAVRRQPVLGTDLSTRVEPVLSQTVLLVPPQEEIRFAQKILDTLSSPALYTRIDLVQDENERLRLMEIELVEPGLWLQLVPSAVERFADAIAKKVQQARGNGFFS